MKCPARFCDYPEGPCSVDEEFAGAVDAEDFYETPEMAVCIRMKDDE